MDLKDKIAVVTGVSKGIGLATVKALLERGAKVMGWGRNSPTLDHPKFDFIQTDVTRHQSVEEAFALTVEKCDDAISVLVNNAGLGFEGKFEDIRPEQWHLMFDTNVHGMYYCIRSILPLMKKQGYGHIVNVSSIAGTFAVPGMTGYAATKHAVTGLSHSLFREVRNFGIKVTCIYPGSVKTNFFDEIESVEANDHMMMPEDIAGTIIHCLEAPDNYHIVDVEARPLKPKG